MPVLVHEQNAVFGRANRLIARFAPRSLALSFADTAAVPAGRARGCRRQPGAAGIRRAGGRGYEPRPAAGSASW